MGNESANQYIEKAIQGEVIPADQRSAYSPTTIYDVGSANITVMAGANDCWHSWNHDRGRHAGIVDAWHAYPTGKGARYAFQSEVFGGVFRYANWQKKAFISMDCHAQVIGDELLARDMSQVIRYSMFLAAFVCGWWKRGGTWALPWCGARSYVGPEDPGGGRSVPYQGICEGGAHGDDLSNILGSRSEAGWEVEPTLRACEQAHNYKRWHMFSSSEVDLMRRVAKIKGPLNSGQEEDLLELAGLLEGCGYVSHVGVHLFKTTEGVGMLCAKSWASGSTSFKYASIAVQDGVDKSEYLEPYADSIDDMWGWLTGTGTLNRKSDVSGTTGFAVFGNRVEFAMRTNAGAAANGFEPGPGRHFEQWRGGSQDPAAWPQGDRVITLPGELLWHVEIRQKKTKVEIHHPKIDGQPDTDPDPDPGEPDVTEPGTKYRLRNIARTLELLKKHDGNVNKAKNEATTDEEFQKTLKGEHDKQKEET